MSSTVVLVNPAAGGGRAGRLWERLAPELAGARTIQASGAEAGRAELEESLSEGAERVIAVGGDGTAHLVANALLDAGHGLIPFGLVPAGTGSDLARGLGLPRDPAAALRQVLAAEPRPIDALRIETAGGEGRFAVNTISAGMSGAVVPAINAKPRRGRFTYLTTTLAALLRYRPVPCRVEIDGEPFCDGRFFLVALTNGRYFGNGMPVAPDASLDDGLIDAVFIPPVPLWQLPFRLPQFLSGRHVELPFVRCRRGEHVRLEPSPGFPPYEVDGECLAAGPAGVRILPGALRVLA
ncbi:MAG: diacylglycerol kinase family lipid kinase [bacterium]|nr:diacylglycerol kinase family lipid kinase [bacterium]